MNILMEIYNIVLWVAVAAIVVAVLLSPILALVEFAKKRDKYDKKTVLIIVLIFVVIIPLVAYIFATNS